MSAVKLEKAIANLEKRLRRELHEELEQRLRRELAPCLARLQAVETRLRPERSLDSGDLSNNDQDRKSEEASEIIEVNLGLPLAAAAEAPCAAAFEVQPHFREAPQAEPEEPGQLETTEEPVAFMETTLNLILVLGYTGSGWIDLAIAALLLFASMGMQFTFCVILLGEEFLGEPFATQLQTAQNWRRSVAHDYRYMDLEQTSLTSRVCNDDGKLILSTEHATLLGQINDFLNLQDDQFETSYFQSGTLLCMLCIFLWCLFICNEVRSSLLSLEAVAQVPRSTSTRLIRGRFASLSRWRFLAYCLLRGARLVVAGGLLYAGVLWLGGTTSITDLILNAVALSAVLQVDEIFYAALMPKQIQTSILDLEAIKVTYTHRRSQLESLFLFALMAGLTLWPYVSIVRPLTEDMLQVKRAYCDGQQDFVVSSNTFQNVTVGLATRPFRGHPEGDDSLSPAQFAVQRWVQQPAGANSKYIVFARDNGHFDQLLFETMSERATEFGECMDWDAVYLGNETHERQEAIQPYFYTASSVLGLPPDSTCSSMAAHCNTFPGRLVRLVCPRICGCPDPTGQPMFKVTSEGCPRGCLTEAETTMQTTPCRDVELSEMTAQWDFFWDTYVGTMAVVLNTDFNTSRWAWLFPEIHRAKQEGCPHIGRVDFIQDPFTGKWWCEGVSSLYAPLAWLCPESCGCLGADPLPAYCPTSCAGCRDADVFPNLGAISNCDQARLAGLCTQVPDQALQFCARTCNLCHLIGNSTAG